MPTDFKPKIWAHNIRIIVKVRNHGGDIIEHLEWRDLRPDIIMKWFWYFRYRGALLQVKYPKDKVIWHRWRTEPSEFTQAQIDNQIKKRRITTCKRMVTKIRNSLNIYERNQEAKLLPDYENERYVNTKAKLEKYKNELKELLNE